MTQPMNVQESRFGETDRIEWLYGPPMALINAKLAEPWHSDDYYRRVPDPYPLTENEGNAIAVAYALAGWMVERVANGFLFDPPADGVRRQYKLFGKGEF